MKFIGASLVATLLLAVVPSLAAQQIYDNGDIITGTTLSGGAAAPTGYSWSEMGAGSGTIGFSSSVLSGFRAVDDFTVPAGQAWTITSVDVISYQTGFAGATSPFTAGTLQIWSGDPQSGGTVVGGDTTTNVLTSGTDFLTYRTVNNTDNTQRLCWLLRLTLSTPVVCGPGVYWIDWQTDISGAGHFSPPVTLVGQPGKPGANAKQFNGTTWVACTDGGTSAPQDFPFKLNGSVGTAAPEIDVQDPLSTSLTNSQSYTVFGAVAGASLTGTFTIRNLGNSGLDVSAVTVSSVVNCTTATFVPSSSVPFTVAASGTENLAATVMPTAGGAFSFTLTIASSDSDEPSFVVNFSGVAAPAAGASPEIAVRHLTNDIVSGSTITQQNTGLGLFTVDFAVRNEGALDLMFTGTPIIAISGATNCTAVNNPTFTTGLLGAASWQSFQDVFQIDVTPTAAGEFTFTITIASNDFDEGTFTIIYRAHTATFPSGGGGGGGGGGSDGGCSTDAGGFGWMLLAGLAAAMAVAVRTRRQNA